jgi:hypothetical protein
MRDEASGSSRLYRKKKRLLAHHHLGSTDFRSPKAFHSDEEIRDPGCAFGDPGL